MSFILDALKKSEQERRQGEVPDLQTPQEPDLRRKDWPLWVYLLIAALLVNGLVAVWGLWPRTPDSPGTEQVDAIATKPFAPVPAPADRSIAPPLSAPLPPAAALDPIEVPEPPPPVAAKEGPALAGNARPLGASRPIPLLSELPAGDRARLPDLNLQLHFFTVQAERRLVRINDLNLREGETGSEGLTVVEITPEGVILDFGGIRFLYPTDWR